MAAGARRPAGGDEGGGGAGRRIERGDEHVVFQGAPRGRSVQLAVWLRAVTRNSSDAHNKIPDANSISRNGARGNVYYEIGPADQRGLGLLKIATTYGRD